MQYDLIIQNGTVIDGSGMPRFRADVGIVDDKIASIGRIRGESAKEVVDAEGHVVAPGFIDGHTHMDAQVSWDPLGTCSCWHGITSVVMGNCGFSLAPCSEENKLMVMRNLERAEDISPEAMEAGIPWSWTTFPEYLDSVERLPKSYCIIFPRLSVKCSEMKKGGRPMWDQAAACFSCVAIIRSAPDHCGGAGLELRQCSYRL